MKNFIFKSSAADLQKMFQYIETKLDILNKNILYVTHVVDKIGIDLHQLKVNENLQKQVDEYFEDDPFGSAFNASQKANRNDKDNSESA